VKVLGRCLVKDAVMIDEECHLETAVIYFS
jgi:hypothetical protein